MATIECEPLVAIVEPENSVLKDTSILESAAPLQANGNGVAPSDGSNLEPQGKTEQKPASGIKGASGTANETSALEVRLSTPLQNGPFTAVHLPASQTAVHTYCI